MIRVSVIVSVLLIVGVNAKPVNKHLKEMVLSLDDQGKLSWGVQVEPPEDMDGLQYEIDPSMRIWNNARNSGQDKHYLKPEEDLDEIYHPSVAELQAQIRKFGGRAEEKDEDQYSPVQMEQSSERDVRMYLQPEEDMDDLYHQELFIPALRQDVADAAAPVELPSPRRYNKPEEDLDDLYHKELLMPVLHPDVNEAPVGLPSQRKYTKPEEDLDGLYHQ